MFCQKCGNEIKDGAKFCDKCGTAVYCEQNITVDSANVETHKTMNFNKTNYAGTSFGVLLQEFLYFAVESDWLWEFLRQFSERLRLKTKKPIR